MTQAAKDAAKYLKTTLRLPSSKFPPRPPPADLARYLPRCADALYAWQKENRPASNNFILHDGPPYANGDLHVGHALNKIIKDIICRSKLADGKRVNYVPGWDCHGLPIEMKVLEQQNLHSGQDVDPVAVRKMARKFVFKTVEKQMAGFRSWAVMGDWNTHWKTMDQDFELRQLSVFKAMADHGLIYRRHKPVYWSPSSRTALAEAELEYKDDHVSTAALVKYPLDHPFSSIQSPVHLLIWTTTPWTLPANQAVAINSALNYVVVKSDTHGHLIVADTRIEYLESAIGEKVDIVQENIPAEDLLRSTYSGLAQFGVGASKRPVVHADFVSAASGTGLVHCAPGHGMEDYEALQPLIKSSVVSVKAPIDDLGQFDDTACPDRPELLSGQSIFGEGNKAVLNMLTAKDLLVHQHDYQHKYPIDWRTKKPVIIRATAQWFADISNIKKDTLNALDAVAFTPDTGKTRLRSFVENRSEWCISRQRAWGVPIPAIYHKATGQAVVSSQSIEHVISTIQDRGIDAWWSDPPHDPRWIAPGLDPADYIRGTDTMDVWFDSGTSWSSVLGLNAVQTGPLSDIVVEGTDQHRGWFQSSLLTNVAYQKSLDATAIAHAPFKSVATHGFTLDAQGKKMSKSLGNVIAPAEIIAGLDSPPKVISKDTKKKPREVHALGPDALRLWVASSDWTKDVVISQTVVKAVHAALDKYRVTMKLLLGLLGDFQIEQAVSYDEMPLLDQVALLQLHRVSQTVKTAYQDLEFHKAIIAINKWVATDLSGFYFEAIKDILYCDSPSSSRRRSAQTALHQIFTQFQHMLGATTPLLIEETWEHTPEGYKTDLEHPLKRVWAPVPAEWNNSSLDVIVPKIITINSAVKSAQEKARSEKLMGQSLGSDVALYLSPDETLASIPTETWQEIFVVSGVDVHFHQDFTEKAQHHLQHHNPVWAHSSVIENTDGNGAMGMAIVTYPTGAKCARCWKYVVEKTEKASEQSGSADVVNETELPLCQRCTDAVTEYEK
ncbi:isoleucine-tRNA ligase [Exophiala mesophila]|uniref:Isoleucine--tRNA ligase, mitochondrial n=1 Tax=Exophiala mesophila TaxID=212818 RepID=A0A0D1WY82_EXOME|nr:isoleucine-tRNA ligase [Exophiala mesophila]KIV94420.1 isoleucine-tRNA ligase [Exophiala mesophila]